MTGLTELLIIGLMIGFWRGWHKRSAPWQERLAAALLPALLGALAIVYYETTALNTRWVWSACRLAPTIGLFHGYPLYSPSATGPINGWLYGPVAALLWIPAALADSPQTALAIAAVINLLFLLGPLLAGSRLGGADSGLLAFVFGAAALLQIYPTWYMASALNVDAIAVGLGAGSCLVLLSDTPPGRKRLVLAAALGVLSVWTKQIEAPLALAQFGWLWFRHGPKSARWFAAAYAGAMLAVAALVCSVLTARDVFFNMWTVPSTHALLGGWTAVGIETTDFCRDTVLFWLPCLIALVVARQARPNHPIPTPAPKARHSQAILLFLTAAAVLLPSGIMASIKVGGDRNSMHSVYYLVVAVTLALASFWQAAASRRSWILHGAVLVASVWATLLAVRQVAGYPDLPILPKRCLSQEAWLFAKERPEQVYFPWDPLATLMADGRMYHFEYGLIDRLHAGRAPAGSRLNQDLPSRLDVVVYPRADYPKTMLRYLPQYGFVTATEDWLIYRKINPKDTTRTGQPGF